VECGFRRKDEPTIFTCSNALAAFVDNAILAGVEVFSYFQQKSIKSGKGIDGPFVWGVENVQLELLSKYPWGSTATERK